MAMSSGGDEGTMLSEINVTPLVDVMLVLLIIFMVTAPMLEQGVEIDLPQAHAQAVDADKKKLVLSIDKKHRVFLGKTFVPFSKLFDKLKYNQRIQSEGEVYLRAERGLPYGLIVEVMAMARRAGIAKVGMITSEGKTTDRGAETQAGMDKGVKAPRAGRKRVR